MVREVSQTVKMISRIRECSGHHCVFNCDNAEGIASFNFQIIDVVGDVDPTRSKTPSGEACQRFQHVERVDGLISSLGVKSLKTKKEALFEAFS